MATLNHSQSTVTRRLCGGELNQIDYLRKITRIIILNKDLLPDDARCSLRDAFTTRGVAPSNTKETRSKANDARSRVAGTKDSNIRPSEGMLASIEELKEPPSKFWIEGLPTNQDEETNRDKEPRNIFHHVYMANRRYQQESTIYRAFYTTATYIMIQQFLKAFDVKLFTDRVLRFCVALIMDEHSDDDVKLVKQHIKDDYKAGSVWSMYANQLGGYGAFFLIGVIPPLM
ncbi:hypothetical protein BDV12DRAFT_198729 [Aspergillus spectabilis]